MDMTIDRKIKIALLIIFLGLIFGACDSEPENNNDVVWNEVNLGSLYYQVNNDWVLETKNQDNIKTNIYYINHGITALFVSKEVRNGSDQYDDLKNYLEKKADDYERTSDIEYEEGKTDGKSELAFFFTDKGNDGETRHKEGLITYESGAYYMIMFSLDGNVKGKSEGNYEDSIKRVLSSTKID